LYVDGELKTHVAMIAMRNEYQRNIVYDYLRDESDGLLTNSTSYAEMYELCSNDAERWIDDHPAQDTKKFTINTTLNGLVVIDENRVQHRIYTIFARTFPVRINVPEILEEHHWV
jgi:hypothetical protein